MRPTVRWGGRRSTSLADRRASSQTLPRASRCRTGRRLRPRSHLRQRRGQDLRSESGIALNYAVDGHVENAAGAIYKGLAIASTPGRDLLYATDFHNGRVDVFDSNFQPGTLPAALHRSVAPEWLRAVRHPERRRQDRRHLREAGRGRRGRVAGPGHRASSTNSTRAGKLLRRIATRGQLNAPWGIALAPSRLRPLQRRPADRQLRRRRDQRVQPNADGTWEPRRPAEDRHHRRVVDRRPVGARSSATAPRTTARQHALLHRRTRRRKPRPVRDDHGELISRVSTEQVPSSIKCCATSVKRRLRSASRVAWGLQRRPPACPPQPLRPRPPARKRRRTARTRRARLLRLPAHLPA